MRSDPAPSALEESLGPKLEAVEDLLTRTASSEHELLADAAGFLIAAGGKRFRPALLLAAAELGRPDEDAVIACAAAIELMHLATLYHDDVMDETEMRRGVDTAHKRFGNLRAILVGDYLFAKASALAAELGTYVAKRLADTIADLVDGQILETQLSMPAPDGTPRVPTVEQHLKVLELKTGALIASSAHLGAYLAGCETATVAAVTDLGASIGLAFQLADDLLDIEADSQASGKIAGTDLREGILTLPAIATLTGVVEGASQLEKLLKAGDIDGALGLLRSNGSLDVARSAIAEQRRRADMALSALPQGDARRMLEELAGSAGERHG